MYRSVHQKWSIFVVRFATLTVDPLLFWFHWIPVPVTFVCRTMMDFGRWCRACHQCNSMWTPTGRNDPIPSIRISNLERSANGKWDENIITHIYSLSMWRIVLGIKCLVRTSLSLSASLICWAINRTPRNACITSGDNWRGNMLSESVTVCKRGKKSVNSVSTDTRCTTISHAKI